MARFLASIVAQTSIVKYFYHIDASELNVNTESESIQNPLNIAISGEDSFKFPRIFIIESRSHNFKNPTRKDKKLGYMVAIIGGGLLFLLLIFLTLMPSN